MNTALFVVLLVVGILAVQVLIWIPIIVWFRRRSSRVLGELATELEGEQVIRGPEKGNYRGATAPGYPVVKNNGVLALTRRRLVFRTLTGKAIEIPVGTIRRCNGPSSMSWSIAASRSAPAAAAVA